MHLHSSWRWEDDQPNYKVVGRCIELLTVRDVRVLGPNALILYKYLARHRGFSDEPWKVICLKKIAAELKMPYRTAKWALAKLAAIGIIQRFYTGHLLASQRYHTELRVRVWGDWKANRKGELFVYWPKEILINFRVNFEPQGRPPNRKTLPLRYPENELKSIYPEPEINNLPLNLAPSVNSISVIMYTLIPSFLKKTRKRVARSAHPYFFLSKPGRENGPIPNNAVLTPQDGAAQLTQGVIEMTKEAAEEKPELCADLFSFFEQTTQQPTAVPELQHRGKRKRIYAVPEPEKPPIKTHTGPCMPPGMSGKWYADTLAAAYNSARQAIYGKPSYVWAKGDISRSSAFGALLRAAKVLVEQEISPIDWAKWRLEYAKEQASEAVKEGKKPKPIPTLVQVFHPDWVEKRYGFFIKSYGLVGTYANTDYYREQNARVQEWRLRYEQKVDFEAALMCIRFIPYHAKRREEVYKFKINNPFELWPSTKPRSEIIVPDVPDELLPLVYKWPEAKELP